MEVFFFVPFFTFPDKGTSVIETFFYLLTRVIIKKNKKRGSASEIFHSDTLPFNY